MLARVGWPRRVHIGWRWVTSRQRHRRAFTLLEPMQHWRRSLLVSGQPTDCYGLDASGTEELQILIIPGNPGAAGQALVQELPECQAHVALKAGTIPESQWLAGYYTPYMEHLHEQLRGRASIRAVSHLGHGPNSSRRSRQRCDLKQQILHKLHYVQQHMSPRTPLVLIGHSIGAFMALAVSNSLEQDPDGHQKIESPGKARTNSKVLALFPFFQTNPGDTEQESLRRLAAVPTLCACIGALLGALPYRLQRWLLVSLSGHEMDEHAITTTLGMLSFVTVRSGFVLGQHEFRDLAAPADWAQLHRLGLGVIYGEKDRWLPRHQWQHFVDLPGLQGKLTAGHNHDFCVSVKSSQHIAELSAAMMEPVLSQPLKK